MSSYVFYTIIISVVIFVFLSIIIRKNLKWNILFCLGLSPFLYALHWAIYSFYNGSGLVGDKGGIVSAAFVIICYLYGLPYIYIPALALIIFSIYKTIKKK